MASIKFDITGDNSDVLKAFRGVQEGANQTARIVEQQGQSIDAVFNRIKNAASMAFAGFTAKEIVSTLATIRGEFQQSEIAFETMLGSATKAKAMIGDLANLAATTPFDMRGVVSGAKQLLAYGIEADKITETMRRLGDVCAGLGLNLQDIAWLYGTTMTQGRLFSRDLYQFTGRGIPLTEELAKQFGVTKEKVSELVTAGKVGFPEVQKAIWSMTDEGGKFGGLMEKQSKSITGQISNIQDTIEMAINDLGTQTEGVMNTALDITSTVVDHWKEIGEAILAAASAIGLYKAMAVGIAAWDSGVTNVGYQAELSALQAILPLKEEEKKTDLEEAVAKGQLSAAQAELVASKREEAAAYVEGLQAKAAAAANEVTALENKLAMQDNEVESLQDAYDALNAFADAETWETAEINLNTAANERNNIAKKLKAAREAAATAATEANTAATQLNTAGTARDTAAKGINAQFTLLCQKAQEAWNASMFASPLFWIAAAVVGVTYAVYKLVTAETAHEAAIRKSNEAWDEFDNKLKERQSTIESLIRTVQSETASEYEKIEAYQKLSDLAPQITEKYDQAALASADFAKTQKEVAESMDDEKYDHAIEEVERYKKEIKKLEEIQRNSFSFNGQERITLNAQIGRIREELEQAEMVLANIIHIQDQAAENAKPIEVKLKEAQENEEVRQKIFDFYDEAMTLANDWQSANEVINFATSETRLDEFITKAQKDIADLREDIKKNPADVNLRLLESEKAKVLDNLLAMKQSWVVTGATTIPLIFRANLETAKQSLNQAKTKASALANSGSTESYATAYTKAQREYQAAQRKVEQMEKNKSRYTSTQYETATQDLKAAKDAYAKLGGDVSGKSAKAAVNARKNRIKEEKKTAKLQEDLNSRLKSLQQKNVDDEISLMQEGTAKKLKEIGNDYKKRLAEIEKQETEFKKKNKEAGKSSSLTKEQADALTEARNLAEQEYGKKTAEVQKEAIKEETQALYDYLKEYGTIQQQKYAIAKEYDEKITNAQGENQKKLLEAQKKAALDSMDASNYAMGIDWSASFKGVGNVLKDIASETLQKVETYMKSDDYKKLDATNKKAYADLRKELRDQQGKYSSPFKASTWNDIAVLSEKYKTSVKQLIKATENHKAAVAELQEAEKELDNATTETAKKIASAKVTTAQGKVKNTAYALNEAQSIKDNAQQNLTDSTEDAAQGLENFSQILSNITSGSLSGFVKGVLGIIDSLKGGTKEVGSVLGQLGGKIGGLIGAIVQIIDALGDNPAEFIDDLLSRIIDAIDGILVQLSNGDLAEVIIKDIAKLIGNIAKDLFYELPANGIKISTFGAIDPTGWFNGNEEEVKEAIDNLTESNENLQKSIDNLKEVMSNTYGKESTYAYEEAKRRQEEYNQNTLKIAEEQIGYHSSHHSWGYYWNERGGFNNNELSLIRQKIKSDFGGGLWDFLTLSPEDMQKMLSYQDIRDAIQNTGEGPYGKSVLEKLDEYAALAGKIDDLTDEWRESITQISFDSMKDNFISNLMDMDKSAEDFADDFAENIQKALLSYSMEDLINGDLKKLYGDWADLMDKKNGNFDENDVVNFQERYNAIVEEGLKRRDNFAAITGYDDISSKEANGTINAAKSMSEDTANELVGRITAVQLGVEGIRSNMVSDISQSMATNIAQMETIMTLGMSTNGAVLEIRNMMVMTNSYLEDMVKYARLSYSDFGNKMDSMIKRLKEI